MIFARPFLAAGLMGVLVVAATGGNDANAQQIYRIVGADGRVTFSDKPPLDPTANAKLAKSLSLPGAAGGDNSALPFELRQVVSRFPVTLYTAPDCRPCGAGRAMLAGRGIPFTEKTVITNEDIEALKRIAGAASLPFITIGGQQLKGYADLEWIQFLDAAGYPQTSQLPATYTRPAPSPLVALQAPEAPAKPAAAPAAETPSAAAPAPSAEPTDNPAGIRF